MKYLISSFYRMFVCQAIDGTWLAEWHIMRMRGKFKKHKKDIISQIYNLKINQLNIPRAQKLNFGKIS